LLLRRLPVKLKAFDAHGDVIAWRAPAASFGNNPRPSPIHVPASTERRPAKIDTIQGFNVRHRSQRGLNYWAASDLAKDELVDFGARFESTMRAPG
jgi:hypothetical protein